MRMTRIPVWIIVLVIGLVPSTALVILMILSHQYVFWE